MTLTDFLLARIAEDERDARQRIQQGEGRGISKVKPSPARVLAECEAKRRIVGRIKHTLTEGTFPDLNRRERSQGHRNLCDLALPYADHPDYREEWKP